MDKLEEKSNYKILAGRKVETAMSRINSVCKMTTTLSQGNIFKHIMPYTGLALSYQQFHFPISNLNPSFSSSHFFDAAANVA